MLKQGILTLAAITAIPRVGEVIIAGQTGTRQSPQGRIVHIWQLCQDP